MSRTMQRDVAEHHESGGGNNIRHEERPRNRMGRTARKVDMTRGRDGIKEAFDPGHVQYSHELFAIANTPLPGPGENYQGSEFQRAVRGES